MPVQYSLRAKAVCRKRPHWEVEPMAAGRSLCCWASDQAWASSNREGALTSGRCCCSGSFSPSTPVILVWLAVWRSESEPTGGGEAVQAYTDDQLQQRSRTSRHLPLCGSLIILMGCRWIAVA